MVELFEVLRSDLLFAGGEGALEQFLLLLHLLCKLLESLNLSILLQDDGVLPLISWLLLQSFHAAHPFETAPNC